MTTRRIAAHAATQATVTTHIPHVPHLNDEVSLADAIAYFESSEAIIHARLAISENVISVPDFFGVALRTYQPQFPGESLAEVTRTLTDLRNGQAELKDMISQIDRRLNYVEAKTSNRRVLIGLS